jgi:hypothetical protein
MPERRSIVAKCAGGHIGLLTAVLSRNCWGETSFIIFGPVTAVPLGISAMLIWVTFLSAGYLLASQHAAPQSETRSLPELIERASLGESNQAGCDRRAHERARLEGLDNDPRSQLIAHYNERLKNCFLEIVYTGGDRNGGRLISRSLFDVRGREYAEFVSAGESAPYQPQESSFLCELILSSGEKQDCHSPDEFNAMLESYMR